MRGPVGEEEDVPRLLLHHAVEDVDELGAEEAGVGGDAEEAEGEERIEALAVAHAHEAPLRVARHLGLLVRVRDRVVGEQVVEQDRVAFLLVRLHGDRLAQLRVGLDVRHGAHASRGRSLAADRLAPERQAAQARERIGVERRPAYLVGLVGVVRLDERPAEPRLVLPTPDPQPPHASRGPYSGEA